MAPKPTDFEERFDRRRDEQRHGRKDDLEKEPRSWRDVDRGKDRSNHSNQHERIGADGTAPKDRYQNAAAQKALKGELEDLFADKEGAALRKAIIDAADRRAVQEAVDNWLEQRGDLPPDTELLQRAVDVRKDRTLGKVVAAITLALPDADADTRKVLLLKLRSKARTTFDAKVGKAIKALLAEYEFED